MHIYEASIILKVYVSPVIWYFVYSSMQDDTYDLLHKRTKKLYKLLLDDTIIFLHTYRYLMLFLRLQIVDSETMLIDMSCTLLHMSFLFYDQETTSNIYTYARK